MLASIFIDFMNSGSHIIDGHTCKVAYVCNFLTFVLTPADVLCCVRFTCPFLCWFLCPEISFSLIDWARLSMFYLRTKT
jgi:hypothetical protein